MTKEKFYKELERIGVDVTDADQMKVWSLALLSMAQNLLDHRTDRCGGCWFQAKGTINGVFSYKTCPNEMCPIKTMPDTPAEVVDYVFERDEPMDISVFFNKYVKPILDELIRREKDARNKNG